ncbi:tuftelin-interacting protein 11-like [Zophobas morio]|uniref:tuftelin-interacting protein 11-like n=1 Tax=Zophobas morio TaxID=2755281 RepID=UPI0030828EA1
MKEVDLPTQMDPNFAAWTKHTKGIGLKLLLKEGHEVGKGLGKDKTGIVYPLQAQLREGKSTGLGYAAQDKSYQKEPLELPKPQGIPSWKKGASCEPLSHMHAVTYEQVQRQTKVIDMRGPQIREFTNYHEMSKAINHETNDFDGVKMSSVSFPELKHNLRLLVDISCNDLGEIESKITMEEDSLYLLKEEMKKLQKFSLKEKEKLTKLIEIKNMIHQYENSTKTLTEKLKLEKCVALFHSLQNTYSREFVAYDLTGLCSALVYPLVQEHLAAWEPHEKPKYGVEMFLLWREILLPPTSVEELALHNREMHDYERMLWDLWLPRIRDSVDLWNPRDYKNNKILKLFEKWRDVIPNWLFHYTLDHLVFSKLWRVLLNL